jgi:transposase InsO family protein
MLHLDVKKLGRVPDGGGKRFAPGFAETMSGPKSKRSLGTDCMHVAIDDHSRLVYVEALPDEKGLTTARFLERALAFFTDNGVTVRRILTDNGGNYRSQAFAGVAGAHSIRLKRTRPYRPQTNGKAEAFNRILQNEWAYSRPFNSNTERLAELPAYLDYYNHHRPHGGIRGATPASRL